MLFVALVRVLIYCTVMML